MPTDLCQWIRSLFQGGATFPAIVFKRLEWEVEEADPAELDLRVSAGLVFEVTNPFGEAITLDRFTPVLEARAGPVRVEFTQQPRDDIVLHPGTHEVTLSLGLDLSDENWRPLLGHDVRFRFGTSPRHIGVAEDLRRMMDDWTGRAIDQSGIADRLGLPDDGAALGELLGGITDELWANLPFNPAGQGLELGFEWTIRLPDLPRVEPKLAQLEIEPVGTRPARVDLGVIRDAADAVSDLRDTLKTSTDLTAPAVSLLDILGEHMDQAATVALAAINALLPDELELKGSWKVRKTLTKTGKQVVEAVSDTAWAPFDAAVDALGEVAEVIPDEGPVVPTQLPRGLIVRLPLRFENTNRFPVVQPAARVLVSGDSEPILRVQLSADGDPLDLTADPAAPRSHEAMNLEVEIRWSAAGKELLDLLDRDDATRFTVRPELLLRGDLGYGAMLLELD